METRLGPNFLMAAQTRDRGSVSGLGTFLRGQNAYSLLFEAKGCEIRDFFIFHHFAAFVLENIRYLETRKTTSDPKSARGETIASGT